MQSLCLKFLEIFRPNMMSMAQHLISMKQKDA